MNQAELSLLLTAKDTASTVMRAFAGVMSSVVVGALSEAARAAAADEANTLKLSVAVENAGSSYQALLPIIAERIKHGQNLAFTDDQTRDSLAALTATTGDFNKALNLQSLAMDIARAKGMDLTTASELVGKVAMGNTGILARYGVVLGENATATDALAALQKKFGGQAEAYGTTTSAAIFKVKDSIDEWKESIGASMGPAIQFVALLPGISSGFAAITGALALLTPAQIAWMKVTGATVAPILLVIATVTLVVAALWQLYETVTFVTDNWNVFVYALTRGDLNDIPIFGFFFQKAQQVIGLIQTVINAWNRLMSIMGQARAAQAESHAVGGNYLGGASVGGYAEGGIVPGPIGAPRLILAHGGEEVRTRAQQASSGMTINVNIGTAYGLDDLNSKVVSAVRDAVSRGGLRGITA